MSTFTNRMRRSILGLTAAGVILSGSALADSAKFDGSWSVQLVGSTGLCGSGSSQVLTILNGSVVRRRGTLRVRRQPDLRAVASG
jgi:hypothetical protein